MLHIKVLSLPPIGFGEEEFKRFLPYIVAIVFIRPGRFEHIFVSGNPESYR